MPHKKIYRTLAQRKQKAVKLSDKPVTIIPNLTYTKTSYARAYGLDPKTVYNMMKDKRLKVIEIHGAKLILAEVN